MVDFEKVLLNLVKPLCSEPDSVVVKRMESLDEDEILLYVYAPSEDIPRLIGKNGLMSDSIRQMLQIAYKVANKHVSVRFEAL